MKKTNPSRMSDIVMRQIKQGNVTMRPRLYFVALSALSVVFIVLLSIVSSYLTSIVFFWIRIQTADTMAWGARANLQDAYVGFPWLAIPVMITALIIIVWLIRKQGTMYRYRLSSVVVFVVIVSLIVGVSLSYLGVGSGPIDGPRDDRSTQRGPGGRGQIIY